MGDRVSTTASARARPASDDEIQAELRRYPAPPADDSPWLYATRTDVIRNLIRFVETSGNFPFSESLKNFRDVVVERGPDGELWYGSKQEVSMGHEINRVRRVSAFTGAEQVVDTLFRGYLGNIDVRRER